MRRVIKARSGGGIVSPSLAGTYDEKILTYLLREGVPIHEIDARLLAQSLKIPYSTVTATLRRLSDHRKVFRTLIVNGFATRYCNEFRLGLELDGREILRERAAGPDGLSSDCPSGPTRIGGPIEHFVEGLRQAIKEDSAIGKHLILRDALILHGAPGRDVELEILTDDGSVSIGRYVRDTLSQNPCVRSIHTVMVGFRLAFFGYSGAHTLRSFSEDGDSQANEAFEGSTEG